MSHPQTSNTSPSNPNNPNNPNHVVPGGGGWISSQGYGGLDRDDDDEVQVGDGRSGFTSREVDQWRTRRCGDSPPRTLPLRQSHVGFGGSSMGTRFVHDGGGDVDGDCEWPMSGETAPVAVRGTELVGRDSIGLVLQSANGDEDPNLGDPKNLEQPRQGQLYGHVQLGGNQMPLHGHVQRGGDDVDTQQSSQLYGHVQLEDGDLDGRQSSQLYGHVQLEDGDMDIRRSSGGYDHGAPGGRLGGLDDHQSSQLYGHVQLEDGDVDIRRSSGGYDLGASGGRLEDDGLDVQLNRSMATRGRLQTSIGRQGAKRSTSGKRQRSRWIKSSADEGQPQGHSADVVHSGGQIGGDKVHKAEANLRTTGRLSTTADGVSVKDGGVTLPHPVTTSQHRQLVCNDGEKRAVPTNGAQRGAVSLKNIEVGVEFSEVQRESRVSEEDPDEYWSSEEDHDEYWSSEEDFVGADVRSRRHCLERHSGGSQLPGRSTDVVPRAPPGARPKIRCASAPAHVAQHFPTNEWSIWSRNGNKRDKIQSGKPVVIVNESNVHDNLYSEIDRQYVNDSVYAPISGGQQNDNYLTGNVLDERSEVRSSRPVNSRTGKNDTVNSQSRCEMLLQEYRRAKSLSNTDEARARAPQHNHNEKSAVNDTKFAQQSVHSVLSCNPSSPNYVQTSSRQGMRTERTACQSVVCRLDEELESLHDEMSSQLNQIESEIERVRGISSPGVASAMDFDTSNRRTEVHNVSPAIVQQPSGRRSPLIEVSGRVPSRSASQTSFVAESLASMTEGELAATLLQLESRRSQGSVQEIGRQTPQMSMSVNTARMPVLQSSVTEPHQLECHGEFQQTPRSVHVVEAVIENVARQEAERRQLIQRPASCISSVSTQPMTVNRRQQFDDNGNANVCSRNAEPINDREIAVDSVNVCSRSAVANDHYQQYGNYADDSRVNICRSDANLNYQRVDSDIEMRTDISRRGASPDDDGPHDDVNEVRRLSATVDQHQLSGSVPSRSSSRKKQRRSDSEGRSQRLTTNGSGTRVAQTDVVVCDEPSPSTRKKHSAKTESHRSSESKRSRSKRSSRRRNDDSDDGSSGSSSSSDDSDDSDENSEKDRGADRSSRPNQTSLDGTRKQSSRSGSDSQSPVRTRRVARKHWIKPDKFDGSQSFETFMYKFRNCAKYNGWNERDKKAHLFMALGGDAAQLLWSAENLTYKQLVRKLKKRFGSEGMEQCYQTELRCRRRKKNESLRELAQDIRRLLILAYPGERSKLLEHIGRDVFLTALNDPELDLKIRERDPVNLDAALKLAERLEVSKAIVETTSGQYKSRNSRQVTEVERRYMTEPDDVDEKINAEVERRLAQRRTAEQQAEQSNRGNFAVDKSTDREENRQKPSQRPPRRNRHMETVTSRQPQAVQSDQIEKRIHDLELAHRSEVSKVAEMKEALAKEAEKLEQLRRARAGGQPPHEQRTSNYGPSSANSNFQQRQQTQGQLQQTVQNSRPGQGGGDRPHRPILCWNCNESGHIMRDCPLNPNQRQTLWRNQSHAVGAVSRPCWKKAGEVFRARRNQPVYLKAKVNGHERDCLLDSGSEVTLLPAALVDYTDIKPTQETLKAANGTEIAVLGKATVTFETVDCSSFVTGLVSENIAEVILGIDWLSENQASWNFSGASVYLNGRLHKLYARNEARKWCRRVVLQEDVEIPARSQVDVPCKVVFQKRPSSDTGSAWTTQSATIDKGIHVARTLTPTDRFNDVMVRVMNVNEEPYVMRKEMKVSDLEQLEMDSVSEVNQMNHSASIATREGTVGELTPDMQSREVSAPQLTQKKNPQYPPRCYRFGCGKKRINYVQRPEAEVIRSTPEFVESLVEDVDDSVSESGVIGLRQILKNYRHVFSESEFDLGRTDIVEHRIETGDARPVRQQLRRYPPAHLEAISEHVENMTQQGIIEPASSPWASNIVLVRKKDGTYRCCIDYRQLNTVTVKDAYPLPRIDMCLDAMSEATWFSTFDMRSSYHQVKNREQDRDKTAFICHRGMFRFRTMPFGLCNAGATFQRLMDIVLTGLNLDICLVYLDDVVVFAKTEREHLERLGLVFERLSRAGLKLKPEKCRFFQKSVKFLGHVISEHGIGTDPEKTKAVAEWPVPTSTSEVRSFVGLASYYRRFVRDFARIAAPLHALTRKDARFRWTDECQEAFETLKEALITPPVLAMPNDEGSFILDTDASDKSIGGVLSQVQDGVERVIAYASRSLDRRETNYCVTRKELLAVVHFLRYFKQYLLGRQFKVRTDHAALSWLRRTPEPIGQQARWLEQLEEYNFTIEHRPGIKHGNADALSRRPCSKADCPCSQGEVRVARISDMTNSCTVRSDGYGDHLFVGSADPPQETELKTQVIQESNRGQSVVSPDVCGTPVTERLVSAQRNDPDVNFVYELVDVNAAKPTWDEISAKSHDVKVLCSFWPRLSVQNGVLTRRFEAPNGRDGHYQVIVPKVLRNEFLEFSHGDVTGHLGFKKSAATLQARAYWPTWSADLASHVKRCQPCAQYHRGTLPRHAELQCPQAGEPWERVSIDITGPHTKSSRQNQYILTVVDHFSKWAEAIPMRDHTASTVARMLMKHVIPHYGTPKQILSDRGSEFESELFSQLMKNMEIHKLRTTAYKPSTNGTVERFHRTLNSMLAKTVKESQRDWDEKLPFVLAAYRSTVHSSTGFTPNKLFLSRENRIPLDVAMGLPLNENPAYENMDDFNQRQQDVMEQSFELAREQLGRSASRRKAAYDTRVRKAEFQVDEWVWYYYPRRYLKRSPKFQKNFVGPFLIVRVIDPVNYVLQKSKSSLPFVVHQDKIKKCWSETPQSWLTTETPGSNPTPTSSADDQLQTSDVDEDGVDRVSDGRISLQPHQPSRGRGKRRTYPTPSVQVDNETRGHRMNRRPPHYLRDYVH